MLVLDKTCIMEAYKVRQSNKTLKELEVQEFLNLFWSRKMHCSRVTGLILSPGFGESTPTFRKLFMFCLRTAEVQVHKASR